MEKYQPTKRSTLEICNTDLNSSQLKSNIVPLADKVSGQRLQILHAQFESLVMPVYECEAPLVMSDMTQDILTHSSSIQKLKEGYITILHKHRFQDTTFYIYKLNENIYSYIDNGFVSNNGFSVRSKTDLSELDINVPYHIEECDNFCTSYFEQYDPKTNTVGFGSNVTCIISSEESEVLDSVCVSERFLEKFVTLRDKVVNIKLNKKRIISSYENIFPPFKTFIKSPLLFKIVKEEGGISALAQDPNSPVGHEDDSINLEPLSMITRIEVFCNTVIEEPILEEYRQDLLRYREEVSVSLQALENKGYKLCDISHIYKNSYSSSNFVDGGQEVKYPLIKLYVKTVSIPEPTNKFTNLAGGKVTINEVYPNTKWTDENGEIIDMIYPANSLINRSIALPLYETHFTSVGMQIKKLVMEDKITPELLHKGVTELFKCINKSEEWNRVNFTPEEFYEYLKHYEMTWHIKSFDQDVVVKEHSMVKFADTAMKYFNWRELKIYNEGVEVSEEHTVGKMFMMRLKHDKYHTTTGTSIPEKDVRGYIVDKSVDKKDGRSVYSKKPSKLSILALHKILANVSNEDANILLQNTNTLHATHELTTSAGFTINTTKVIRNRKEKEEEED